MFMKIQPFHPLTQFSFLFNLHFLACGSCWAFAGAAALEGAYYIKQVLDGIPNPQFVSFSEQDLVDCVYNTHPIDILIIPIPMVTTTAAKAGELPMFLCTPTTMGLQIAPRFHTLHCILASVLSMTLFLEQNFCLQEIIRQIIQILRTGVKLGLYSRLCTFSGTWRVSCQLLFSSQYPFCFPFMGAFTCIGGEYIRSRSLLACHQAIIWFSLSAMAQKMELITGL